MAEQTDDMSDMDFAQLFSSLDSIKASDSLKSATLDAIFSAADNNPLPETDNDKTDDKPEHKGQVIKFSHKGAHSKRNPHRLRIAGIAACFALLGTIGTAYNMPTSYACVNYDDTTLTLGINPMGVTVSADADSDRGKKLIEENDLTGTNYRDSVGTAATSIAEQSESPESSIELSVSSNDAAQRESVKKGSSEAIEISGYKKAGSDIAAKSAKKSAKDITKDSADSAASSNPGSANATTDADAEDESNTFIINTDETKESTSKTSGADGSSSSVTTPSKYHPLSDGSKASDTQTESESEATSAAEASISTDSASISAADSTSTEE